MEDTTCDPITFELACPVGFYAREHTCEQIKGIIIWDSSLCLQCAVCNKQYEGQWLHEFTLAGREYNNLFSCETKCLPFSRLINSSDTSFGCKTCETRNVLFKLFTQDMLVCRFACLEGYVPVCGDCTLGVAEGDELMS